MQEKMEAMEEEKKTPQMNSQTINGLVILFYKNLLTPSSKQYTIALSLCRALAKRMEELDYLQELEIINRSAGIGYNLGLLQTIAYRDIIIGITTNKTYNYGFRSRSVKLGDIIVALDSAMDRILDIFTAICVKHDIDTSFTSPIIEGLEIKNRGL